MPHDRARNAEEDGGKPTGGEPVRVGWGMLPVAGRAPNYASADPF